MLRCLRSVSFRGRVGLLSKSKNMVCLLFTLDLRKPNGPLACFAHAGGVVLALS
jgi:hypothetical protein